ncbi:MAG: cupredoxin domain-containing protein [Bradyrhizobiaceae bacterium]|nr:cupredoxin domain-containing protein [Bradyrhizobiaceae bacterium]
MGRIVTQLLPALVVLLLINAAAPHAQPQDAATVQVSVKNHQFEPAQIRGPANKPIQLRVKNLDATPMEFESVSLRVEKVVAANSDGVINLRPLQPGQYNFFDDFHQQTTGVLVIE